MTQPKLYRGVHHQLLTIEKRHERHQPKLQTVLTFSLLISFATLLASSLALFPFLLVLSSFPLYIILIFLGIIFGLLFDFIVYHSKAFRHYQLLKAGALLFFSGFAVFFITTVVANNILQELLPARPHNPFVLSFIYAGSFVLPYFYTRKFFSSRALI